MLSFDEFLLKLKEWKSIPSKRKNQSIRKLGFEGLANLVMLGAFDSLLGYVPSLEERHSLIGKIRNVLKSKAALTSKGEAFSLNDLNSELRRSIWIASKDPTYRFSMAGFYNNALLSMGFSKVENNIAISYTNNGLDLMYDLASLYQDKPLEYYSSRSCKRTCGVVALFLSKKILPTKKENMFRAEIVFTDGVNVIKTSMFSKRGKDGFDKDILNKLEKNLPMIIVGSPSLYKESWSFFLNRVILLSL